MAWSCEMWASSWASLVLNATSQVSTSKSAVLFSGRELADAGTLSKATFVSFCLVRPSRFGSCLNRRRAWGSSAAARASSVRMSSSLNISFTLFSKDSMASISLNFSLRTAEVIEATIRPCLPKASASTLHLSRICRLKRSGGQLSTSSLTLSR